MRSYEKVKISILAIGYLTLDLKQAEAHHTNGCMSWKQQLMPQWCHNCFLM